LLQPSLNSVEGFENPAVLDADFQPQRCSLLPKLSKQGLMVRIRRDIHFINHDVVARIVATAKYRLEIGLADIFNVAAPLKQDPGNRCNDARPVLAEDRDGHFFHGCALHGFSAIFLTYPVLNS